jgi:hypothetical protein
MDIESNDDVERHALDIGRLIVNLHSLEFLLRVFLSKQPDARPWHLSDGREIYSSPVGSTLPVNDLTSYDSLMVLIQKFNKIVEADGKEVLDLTLVDLRDALAHGRVSKGTADQHLRLLKFDRPMNNQVRVSFNQVMSPEWFKEQRARVIDAVRHVYEMVDS